MPESELPPVYVKKETKRSRSEAGFFIDGRRPNKIRKDDNYFPPRSLFDRPSPALAKLRRELKLQRYRGIFKPYLPGLKQQPLTPAPIQTKQLVEPEGMPEWTIYEDMSLLNIVQNMQGLPLNLMLLSPGHTPNWDLVADIVNQISRVHRTPKQCRYRYEAVIVPREEGKIVETPKKQQKKTKNLLKSSPPPKTPRALRSAQMFANDNNASFTKFMRNNFDHVRAAYMKKAPQLKQILVNPSLKNPKHAAVLAEFGVTNYDIPMTPMDIAARRAEKIKERQRIPSAVSQTNPPELVPQQLTSQPIVQSQAQIATAPVVGQQTTAFVVQQQPGVTQVLPSVATIVQAAQNMQVSRTGTVTITTQQQPQIVKAIVAASPHSSNILGMQHVPITQQTSQAQQIQQMHPQTATIVSQSPVSVVLTAPVSSIQTIQPQIVSIHQNVITSNANHMSQAGTLVQTLTTQSTATSQVVSMAQIAAGTVFTTAALSSNAVATLSGSTLRAQRIVSTSGAGGIQEMVFTPRSGSQSPTVVSVSGLTGQAVTQGHLQPQLRLSMATAQQISGVVKGGIPVSSLNTAGKPTQSAQFQLLRQNPASRQFKLLGQGNTVVQTVSGPISVVNTGGIIQGGIVSTSTGVGQTLQLHQATGQKVSIATVSANAAGLVTNVGSAGMANASGQPQRALYMKQIPGKQAITRTVNDTEMLLVKRQMINTSANQLQQQQGQSPGQQKTQIISQFPPIQLQQAGASGQQHIATLVKTSTGTVATAGTVGMALAQLKPGLKGTLPNTGVRQMQFQQIPITHQQQRKSGKMAQITQVTGTAKPGTTQLIVQNSKGLQPGTVMQQFVLGKNVKGIIPVSGITQHNRPIQVSDTIAQLAPHVQQLPCIHAVDRHGVKYGYRPTLTITITIFNLISSQLDGFRCICSRSTTEYSYPYD